MFIRPDTSCKKCNYTYFDMSENGLIFTCINCSEEQEYFNGTELTLNVINGIKNSYNEDGDE